MQKQTKQDPTQLDAVEIVSEVQQYLQPVTEFLAGKSAAQIGVFFKDVPFGSGGAPEYRNRLCSLVKSKFQHFEPEGFSSWSLDRSEGETQLADVRVKKLVNLVHEQIFVVLKNQYGDAYWKKGVSNKELKKKAYERRLDDDDEKPEESYLDLIDLKKIAEDRDNWPVMKPLLDIPLPGESGLAKNLKWVDRLNKIRRIAAHPYNKSYSPDDIVFLGWLEERLQERIRIGDAQEAIEL